MLNPTYFLGANRLILLFLNDTVEHQDPKKLSVRISCGRSFGSFGGSWGSLLTSLAWLGIEESQGCYYIPATSTVQCTLYELMRIKGKGLGLLLLPFAQGEIQLTQHRPQHAGLDMLIGQNYYHDALPLYYISTFFIIV